MKKIKYLSFIIIYLISPVISLTSELHNIDNRLFTYLTNNGIKKIVSNNKSNALIREVINSDIDINFFGDTLPIHRAIEKLDLQGLIILCNYGADVTARKRCGFNTLHIAAEKGSLEIIKYLCMIYCKQNNIDLKKEYSTKKFINSLTVRNKNPLYYAVRSGNLQCVEYLVKKGASVNQVGKANETPLYEACDKGYLFIAKYLIKKGADINITLYNGNSLLHLVCKKGHLSIVKYLVNLGLKINSVNKYNETPIMCAIKSNHTLIVEFLLNNVSESEINIKSRYGGLIYYISESSEYFDQKNKRMTTNIIKKKLLNKVLVGPITDIDILNLIDLYFNYDISWINLWIIAKIKKSDMLLNLIEFFRSFGEYYRQDLIDIAQGNFNKIKNKKVLDWAIANNNLDSYIKKQALLIAILTGSRLENEKICLDAASIIVSFIIR